MTKQIRYELISVISLAVVLAALGAHSILYARSVVRDDLRKQDIANIKRSAEQYFNAHNSYPAATIHTIGCTQSSKDSWFFGESSPLLREQFIDAIPHDVRESKGFVYSYCITGIEKNIVTSFYLQAQLESQAKDGVFFDEDEHRKFNFRILHENGKTLYRVCGGQEHQCGA